MKTLNKMMLMASKYKAGRILLHVIVAVSTFQVINSLKGIIREF